jgi:hypothetical protein
MSIFFKLSNVRMCLNLAIPCNPEIGYGVTANIAASHSHGCLVRGSSGFDSPYPNIFLIKKLSKQKPSFYH